MGRYRDGGRPICARTDILSEGMSSGVSATPSARMTYAKTPWPLTSCGTPTCEVRGRCRGDTGEL